MHRVVVLVAASGLALIGCAERAVPEPDLPVVAPTPGAPGAELALRRCDDGGDGGVLIDGICL